MLSGLVVLGVLFPVVSGSPAAAHPHRKTIHRSRSHASVKHSVSRKSRSYSAKTHRKTKRQVAKRPTSVRTVAAEPKKIASLSPEIVAAARQPFLRAADIRSRIKPLETTSPADTEALHLTANDEGMPPETTVEGDSPDEATVPLTLADNDDTVPVEPEPSLSAEPEVPSPAMALETVSLVRTDNIVRSALSYRGAPYRLGATGRYGAFDCSSFTRHILGKSGSSLPRTASEQFHQGTPVAKGELLAGDLVFFKNTYKRGISHVGIYIGNDKFIHASNRRTGVTVTSLSTAYYSRHYAGARRVR